jgi:hypothetical protein
MPLPASPSLSSRPSGCALAQPEAEGPAFRFLRSVSSVPPVAESPSSLRPLCSKLFLSRRASAFSAPQRYHFPRLFFTSLLLSVITFLSACSHAPRDPSSLTFLIESNPTNLDPRFATDAQSQRIDGLLFSGLLQRDAQMNRRLRFPGLAPGVYHGRRNPLILPHI